MKEKDVPQDDGMLQGKTRDLYYVLDENGNYVPALSTGWEPKNIVLQQAWEIIDESIQETKNKVLQNLASPLLYHMECKQMDLKLLSKYSGIPKHIIKNHLKPMGLDKASDAELDAYAEALGMDKNKLNSID